MGQDRVTAAIARIEAALARIETAPGTGPSSGRETDEALREAYRTLRGRVEQAVDQVDRLLASEHG